MEGQKAQSEKLRAGLVELGKKRYEAVHSQALAMIKVNTSDPVPYCLLATIAADHGNHRKACELYERAAALAPDGADFQAFLGRALTTIGRQTEAKAAADKAAALTVSDAHIADMIGVIYSRTGFHQQAVPWFEKAVALNPEPANFHYNLAASLQFLGEFERAEQAYLETLKRDDLAYRAYSSLVGLKKQTSESHYLSELKALFEKLSNDEDGRLHVGHAIAKTLEDLGDYETSLEWLHQAKTLKRQKSGAQAIDFGALFKAAKQFQPARQPTNDLVSRVQPIFVIGMPRTGTTLIDRVLSSHSQVVSAGELNAFPGLIKTASGTPSNLVLDIETLDKAEHLDLADVGQQYLKYVEPFAAKEPFVLDKMPLNFFYAGLIHRALPEAKIVALRRGPMDSCLSNYRQLLTVQDAYYRYTYDLAETATFYRNFDGLMRFWREHLPTDRFIEVHYEDVVLNQETETRRLLEFCGLPFEEACLRFHENEAPVSTASSVQVRQPLYSGSIGRWQRYGDKLKGLEEDLADLNRGPH